MKIVFDEAGNTGCLLTNKDILNFKTQPLFSIGAAILADEADERALLKRYSNFISRNNIKRELKGSELMKRENNKLLFDFVENVLDDTHFSLNLYDKKFYLSSLLCVALLGREFQLQFPQEFYSEVSSLAYEGDEFFVRYCNFIKSVTEQSLHDFLQFMCDYEFQYLCQTEAVVLMMAKKILDSKNDKHWLNDFMTFGWYSDSNKTNVINLVALGELIDAIKRENPNITNTDITFIHDNVPEFERLILDELSDIKIKVNFADSKSNLLIQIADNAVSIFYKIFVEVKKTFAAKTEWLPESAWLLILTSKVMRKVSIDNIKFTIPVQDWAMMLCVKEMFSPDYPATHRNNIFFNEMYCDCQRQIAFKLGEATQDLIIKSDGFENIRR